MRELSPFAQLTFPLVLDGGLSNVLESKGCDLNHPLWTAEVLVSNPEAIVQTHLEYLKAGAQCLTTSGYQASIPGLSELGHDFTQIRELILKPVKLAEEAIDRFMVSNQPKHRPLIAASIGPYGAYLGDGSEYRGHYGLSDAALKNFHLRRIEWLETSGADLLAIETIPSLQEAKVLIALLANCKKPSWISFSCKDDSHLNDGSSIEEACELIESTESVFGIGINCTAPSHISGLISKIKAHVPAKKLVIYPNSGEVFNPIDKTWKGISVPEDYAIQALEWVNEGADIIGGCCRIGPNHIDEITRKLLYPDVKTTV